MPGLNPNKPRVVGPAKVAKKSPAKKPKKPTEPKTPKPGHPNSIAAWMSMWDQMAPNEKKILEHLAEVPSSCDATQIALGMSHQTCSSRFSDLSDRGMIVVVGQTTTRSGRTADVYAIPDYSKDMAGYRTVGSMTADELLAALREGGHRGGANAVNQAELFVRLGGDPADHDYARLSFLTQELRDRGVAIGSSRSRGLWLE